METVVLVIHLIVALAIIALVLLQRSEGGGLGMGGGGAGNFATARGTATAMTRMTAICAAIFFATSLTLGVMASRGHSVEKGILENVDVKDVPVQAPVEGENPGISFVPPENLPNINEVQVAPEAPIEDEPIDQLKNDKGAEISAPVEGEVSSDSKAKAVTKDEKAAKPAIPTPPTAE